MESEYKFHGTTILSVRRGENVVIAGDGQVTLGNTVIKSSAAKVRRLYENKIIAGFAGATADAFTLFDKFEAKLKEYSGSLTRAAVELAKEWRTDKYLRRLEAFLLVADKKHTLIITGIGDVLEPEDYLAAIGSGGQYAKAAAKALLDHSDLKPAEIAKEAMKIAASICIYTNDNLVIEEL